MARRASHAGLDYKENAIALEQQLEFFLQATDQPKQSDARAIIAPHASYHWSGQCAAFAFAKVDPETILRVFILGPSHYHRTRKCLLSKASVYKCPLRDLPIDLEVYKELKATEEFEDMDMNVDEAEFSLETHVPFIAKVFEGRAVKLVPILVGALSYESQVAYGKILAKYIDNPSNFFCISSDFCHWGSRYKFTRYDKKHDRIHKSIEALDRNGMNIIESGDPEAFRDYLQETGNTICGQKPILVFLNMLKHCTTKLHIKFLNYNHGMLRMARNTSDSGVSYASAVATVAGPLHGASGSGSSQDKRKSAWFNTIQNIWKRLSMRTTSETGHRTMKSGLKQQLLKNNK